MNAWLIATVRSGSMPGIRLVASLAAALIALALLVPSSGVARAQTTPEAFAPNVPLAGELAGRSGGAAVNYPFPGDGAAVTVILRYANGNPVIDPGVGFIVYQGGSVVANVTEAGNLGNGVAIYQFQTSPGSYDLQVYNYIEGFTMRYWLLLADPLQLPQVGAAPGAAAPDTAVTSDLARGQSAVRQVLGSSSGSIHNYVIPGDGQPLTLAFSYAPRDPIRDMAVGLNLYDQWGNLIQSFPMARTATPSAALVYTFTPQAGVVYDAQVFNYQPGVSEQYVLAAF